MKENSFDFVFWLKVVTSAIAGFFIGLPLLVKTLITLMVFDILMGILTAWSNRRISSEIAVRGFMKKSAVLILVGAIHILEAGTHIPLAAAVTTFFCCGELLSMLENGVRLGIPIPKGLKERLEQFRSEADEQGLTE